MRCIFVIQPHSHHEPGVGRFGPQT